MSVSAHVYGTSMQANPLAAAQQPQYLNLGGHFGSGSDPILMQSATYRALGSIGQSGLLNNQVTITSPQYHHRPGFLSAFLFTTIFGVPSVFTSGSPPNGVVGVPYSFAVMASNNPTFSVSTGTLPPGLTLAPNGLLSGTPSQTGTFHFTMVATNGTLPNATQNVTVIISAPVFLPVIVR